MEIKNLRFRPGVFAVVITLVAVTIFTSLAIWQVFRAAERRQIMDEILQRSSQSVEQFARHDVSLERDRYRRYILNGTFQNEHQVLLDNVVRDGKPGYEVITPFHLKEGGVVLVNRGWVAAGRDRQILPDITVDTQVRRITASVDKPRSPPVVSASLVESGNRWNYLDVAFFRQHSGLDVPDYLLLLSSESDAGYNREWPQVTDKSGMHIGYAIHWALFAFASLATFIGVNLKRIDMPEQD